ncbi:MAG TPA: thioredoxin family protein [Burkholderiaceae bacterium]|nr:thioredoxin family protein [Burkholderiaceae bacterium]
MKRALVTGLLLSLAANCPAAWWSLLSSDFQEHRTLEAALAAAKASDQPVIIYYTRQRCPPCDVLRTRLSSDPLREHYAKAFHYAVIWGDQMDSTERAGWRDRYGVSSAPTWVVMRSDGGYLCTAVGGFGSVEGGLRLFRLLQKAANVNVPAADVVRDCKRSALFD